MSLGILSTLALEAGVHEVTNWSILGNKNPLYIRSGSGLGGQMDALGIPDGVPQAVAVVALGMLAKKFLNQHKMNPGIKIGRRNYIRLV